MTFNPISLAPTVCVFLYQSTKIGILRAKQRQFKESPHNYFQGLGLRLGFGNELGRLELGYGAE